jgi:hypothetical protein
MPQLNVDGPGTSAFDERVAEAMKETRFGAVLLLELVPPWPLQVRWLKHQLAQLCPVAVLHDAGESVLAVLAPGLGTGSAWALMEHLRERATHTHLDLLMGVATWPIQGSTPVEVVSAAAAALLDEHARHAQGANDETQFEVDGRALFLDLAGELLTG